MIDEKAVERSARAICIAAGYEPEQWADSEDLRNRCLKYAAVALEALQSAKPKEAEGWQDIASADRKLDAVLGYQATPRRLGRPNGYLLANGSERQAGHLDR